MEKKVHNKELYKSYYPQGITAINSRNRLTGRVACVETEADCVSGYPEGLLISSLPPGNYRSSTYSHVTK